MPQPPASVGVTDWLAEAPPRPLNLLAEVLVLPWGHRGPFWTTNLRIPRQSGIRGRLSLLAGVRMKRWVFLVIGVVLAIAGVVWILQGLNLLGQSGGMNGQHVWAIIGAICVLAGLGFSAAGVRARRTMARMPGSH
jgi:hypothetical protein